MIDKFDTFFLSKMMYNFTDILKYVFLDTTRRGIMRRLCKGFDTIESNSPRLPALNHLSAVGPTSDGVRVNLSHGLDADLQSSLSNSFSHLFSRPQKILTNHWTMCWVPLTQTRTRLTNLLNSRATWFWKTYVHYLILIKKIIFN